MPQERSRSRRRILSLLPQRAGTNNQTRCINTAITNITYSTTGATGATFSGLPTGVTWELGI